MWWMIGMAIYAVLLLVGLMFLRGGNIREYSSPVTSLNPSTALDRHVPKRNRRLRWDRAAVGGGRG